MLQRKLLIRIGLLIACFVAGAAVAIYLLQSTIAEVRRVNSSAIAATRGVLTIGQCVAQIENQRSGLPTLSTDQRNPEVSLSQALEGLAEHAAVRRAGSSAAESFEALRRLIPTFLSPSEHPAAEERAMHAELQAAQHTLAGALQEYTAKEQEAFGRRFRGLVLGLTLAALVMSNVAVLVLFRTARMVLNPVAELVRGSRELAAEHFDHRVLLRQDDEFGELAHAYNQLAGELQENEERKAEAIRQLAVTLNHDLNNAIATIEMQLRLVDRRSGHDQILAKYCRDMQEMLTRMGQTIASLKNVRRVVLTDYMQGQKMVDLERSVMPPPVSEGGASPAGA